MSSYTTRVEGPKIKEQEDGIHRYRAYNLVMSDSTTESEALTYAKTIHAMYSLDSSDEDLWLTQIQVSRDAKVRSRFTATFEFTPKDTDEDLDEGRDTSNPIYPWNKPPVISYGFQNYNAVIEKAYKMSSSGKPIDDRNDPTDPVINSANDPFDPPVQETLGKLEIRINRNEQDVDMDPDDLRTYKDTINLEQITVGQIKLDVFEGRMETLSFNPEYYKGHVYWKVSYGIIIDPKTWVRSVLDQGYNELTTDSTGTTVKTIITDDEGREKQNPSLLDGQGYERSQTDPNDAYYLDFYTLWPKDWSALNLPEE